MKTAVVIVHVPTDEALALIDAGEVIDADSAPCGRHREDIEADAETLRNVVRERDHLAGHVTELQALLSAVRYGRLARQEGAEASTNPHDPATARALHEKWVAGWQHADLEARVLPRSPPSGSASEVIERAIVLALACIDAATGIDQAVDMAVVAGILASEHPGREARQRLCLWSNAHPFADPLRHGEGVRQFEERVARAVGLLGRTTGPKKPTE